MVLSLICVAVIITVWYFIYQYRIAQKLKKQVKNIDSVLKNKYRILTYLDGKKGKQFYKMKIMEDLSLGIEPMKMCVKQLKSEKLITEDANSIALTDFGKSFAKVFVKGEKGV